VHTPIVTGSDCEGAGELFRVTTLDLKNPPKREDGAIDYGAGLFARPTYLTVSGQLEAEAFACALAKVYTFGPTFRAENSNTSRHASEFWMIEPEQAFCDLVGNMDLAEEFVKYLIRDVRTHCAEDLELFAKFVDKELLARLDFVVERPFQRVSYTEAVELLVKCGKTFEYPVEYGTNLQSEHERYLTEVHFKCPVTVYNYPKEIKPFYMRLNDDDRTVTAMDVLVPGIGEIIGGKPTRGTARCAGGQHGAPPSRPEGLRLVSGPAPLWHGAACRIRHGLRADADVRHRRLEHPAT